MSGRRIGKQRKAGKIRASGKPGYDRYEWSLREILQWSAEGTLICAALDFLFYRSLLLCVLFPPAVYAAYVIPDEPDAVVRALRLIGVCEMQSIVSLAEIEVCETDKFPLRVSLVE